MQSFSLKGKVAAVTGGARGIGLEVSRGLAEAGASAALIYSTTKNAADIAAAMERETGVTCRAYQANVSSADEVEAVLTKIDADFGGLDIVVANAGVTANCPAEDYTPEAFSELMKINLDGAFYTAQSAARIFKRRGNTKGNIIFTASVSALLVNLPQKQAAYNASKAGLVQLARCLSVEWVDFCRVNCVSPGFIATDMLDQHPKEWHDKWMSMVPAARVCEPHELKGVSSSLVWTDHGEH